MDEIKLLFYLKAFYCKWKVNCFDQFLSTLRLKVALLKFISNCLLIKGNHVITSKGYFTFNICSFINRFKKLLFNNYLIGLNQGTNNILINKNQILNEEEYQKIVYESNQTQKDYQGNKTIHGLFECQVAKVANNIAIVYEGKKLTYKELNQRSNQLAHYLIKNYLIKPDDLILLCLDRSEHMPIAILAVLKAGGAYVPIDPNYPDKRINYILDDTKAKLIIANEIYQSRLDKLTAPKINMAVEKVIIDSLKVQSKLRQQEINNPLTKVKANNLSYVIYTSGTTGKPKGVMLEHKGIVNLATCQNEVLELNDKKIKNFLGYANYVFDAHVWELFTALLNSHTLYIIASNVRQDLNLLKFYINENNIHLALIPPALLTTDNLLNLKTLIVGGDKIDKQILKSYLEAGIKVVNAYGPTEITVISNMHVYRNLISTNIGKPLANIQAYILDNNLQPVPFGAIGELYIGGVGLARGYLNLLELTAERFIVNPFQTEEDKQLGKNARLYKTGDLVKWIANGDIEYIGRSDFQVKLRGYRIELGEIEAKLNSYPEIKQSIVLVKEQLREDGTSTGNKYLIGYYVASGKLNEEEILNFLEEHLPDYMIPNILVYIQKLPLTINGKLDINSLPEPNLKDNNYMAPKNELENKIISIWSEILKMPAKNISTLDSFFRLGGNSILIGKLKNELIKLKEFQHIQVVDLFKYISIQQLIEFTKTNKLNKPIKIAKDINKYESEIAIIGMSAAFSGCDDVNKYWDLLYSGHKGTQKFSIGECRKRGVAEELLQNPNFVPISGHITDIDKFDAEFWGLIPNEAKVIDPQIRKFLEHCWYLLESAGYLKERSNLDIGVFAGGGNNSYLHNNILHANEEELINLWEAANLNVTNTLATRVSYLLGLTGPANTINTACSTSLVTIIEACEKLAAYKCSMAIAGGVSLLLPEETGYIYQEGMIWSKDGHCRVFDIKSSGTVAGSGVGAVLLKRLSDAKQDKDHIFAVIRGYATNNDGNRKISYTAPSVIGQKECIVNAQRMAGITADLISYVECHGTGTKLGDPIEVQALNEAFRYNSNKDNLQNNKCIIGSVKANIGHTDAASGIAGVIKVCKMFEHNVIPKQINYREPNQEINLSDTNFEIITENKIWQSSNNLSRIAGISSFGIGGTNAHVIISDYGTKSVIPPFPANSIASHYKLDYILPLSAKSKFSLDSYKVSFLNYLKSTEDRIEDIAYTLQLKREYFAHRLSINCTSIKEAIEKLQVIEDTVKIDSKIERENQDIIFMFPGQGTQYSNMSLNLYQGDEDYKNILDNCFQLIGKYTNMQFKKILFPALFNSNYDINETQWAQPALFIVSYSLAKLLEKLNIKASLYIGHSIGEWVAATLAGVFSLENAIKLVIARGQLMQSMPKGSMLLVKASVIEVKELIVNTNCDIAVVNSPQSCVIAGKKEQIASLKNKLDKIGLDSITLKVSHAYHSYLMEGASKKFIKEFEGIKLNTPKCKFVSNITGNFITDKEATSPEYWTKHIRATVQFNEGVEFILNKYSNPYFIEVGPGKSLIAFIRQIDMPQSFNGTHILDLQKEQDVAQAITSKETILSKLWMHGCKVDFLSYYPYNEKFHKVVILPRYSFDNKSLWVNKSIEYDKDKLKVLSKDKWLSAPVWKKVIKLNYFNETLIQNSLFLIFKNKDYKNFDSLITDNNKVIFIEVDNEISKFEVLEHARLAINPTSENAYQEVLTYLKDNDIKPDVIIHAITLVDKYPKELTVDEELNKGLYSLFLIQRDILSNLSSEVKFVILTQGIAQITEKEEINAYNGAMVGAFRSIKHELADIKSSILDIGYGRLPHYSWLLNFIANDNNFIEDNLYAIQFQALWEESFESINGYLPKEVISDNDVILITGGLGGIGLSIANYISQKHKVTFILVSRNNIHTLQAANEYVKSQLAMLESIKANNCTIDICYLDISDKEKVRQLIQRIYIKYNKISGVIHTAGRVPLLPSERTLTNIKLAIQAKVNGATNIIDILKDQSIKYFIMTSSLASIMGDINRIEYCAANSYLDYLAVSSKFSGNCQVLSINWPGWSDVGMLAKQKTNQEEKFANNLNFLTMNVISQEEGSKLFYSLIQQRDYPRIAVSKLDIKLLKKHLFKTKKGTHSIDSNKTQVLEDGLPEGYNKVIKVFLNVLGIDKISIYDNFFALGGNSLSAIKLISQLKKIGINLTLSNIVNANTIDKIYKLDEINKVSNLTSDIILPLSINNHSNKNVFFIHPVGGTIIMYLDIVRNLNKKYNYYGIQNINGVGKKLIQAGSLEELSSIYLNEILKIQSTGEYILMGSSMGGTIAYEIARQLTNLNKKIKYVAMFDSWAFFSKHFHNKSTFININKEQEEFKEVLKDIEEKGEYANFLLNARWMLMKLLLKYKPKKTNILIHLYKALDLDKDYIANGIHYDNGWQRYTQSIIKIHNIPGNHVTIHNKPGVTKIIDLLNESLD